MKYSRKFHPENSTSTHLIVKKLQLESYNCIIVYKPHGQPVETSPSIYNGTDIKKRLTCTWNSNQKMIKMFK